MSVAPNAFPFYRQIFLSHPNSSEIFNQVQYQDQFQNRTYMFTYIGMGDTRGMTHYEEKLFSSCKPLKPGN